MSDDRAGAIFERLKGHGGRVTRPRRIVVDAMLAAPEHHLTGPDVVAAVRREHPDFYESTVYRTLERLVELGAVERVHIGPGPAVFHLAGRAHHHLVCDGCGAVVEVDGDVLDAVAARVLAEHGFTLRPADASTLAGRCARCS